ncbi:hypothetical protein Tco_0843786 [Tanacetum coccineum]
MFSESSSSSPSESEENRLNTTLGGPQQVKKGPHQDDEVKDLALYDNESWNDPRDFAKPVKAISLPQDVPSTSERRLIELKNQGQRLMEAHIAPKSSVQVNKIASSCEICSGPHDTQYCMENPEQAFFEYASSRHVHVEKAYIDLNSLINVMNRMQYNWIMRKQLELGEDPKGIRGISNFTGRIRGMHILVGNFTYVLDFMIVEDISSIIDPRLWQVVLGRPFVEISNMTYDLTLRIVRFANGTDKIAYRMPHKREQFNSLSDLKKEHTKSVYFRNEKDKRGVVDYVMNKILGFYKECLNLRPEYLTGLKEGEVSDTRGVTGKLSLETIPSIAICFVLKMMCNILKHSVEGRKAYLLEDKQIQSVGVFDEVIWESFGGYTRDLDSIWEETGQDCSFTRSGFKELHTMSGDGIAIPSDAVRTDKGRRSGYHQKDRKPSQNDKTEHGMEKTVQNQGQSPKMTKSESILKNQQSNLSME